MAVRVASFAPVSVLETAAGSGVVSRVLITHLHPDARYVVTDLNQPMLDHAASRVLSRPRFVRTSLWPPSEGSLLLRAIGQRRRNIREVELDAKDK